MSVVYDRFGVQVHHGGDRICPACNSPLVRRVGERACDFKARTFCDRRCRGIGQRASVEPLEVARGAETPDERRKRLGREASRRTRARKRGVDIPPKPHPRGYTQQPEHIAAMVKAGSEHPQWRGDQVSVRGGRTRALRLYPDIGPCTRCGSANTERHHIDENTANNDPDNIAILCRRCHMVEDGRLDAVRRTPYRGISYG